MIDVEEEGNVLHVRFPRTAPNLLAVECRSELLYLDDAVAFGRLTLLLAGEVILSRHVVAEIEADDPGGAA